MSKVSPGIAEENDLANEDIDATDVSTLLEKSPAKEISDEEVPTSSFNSWLRLMGLFLAAIICGGLLPGQAVFNELFVSVGLFANVCEDGVGPCEEQYLSIANIMNTLSLLILFMWMPAGLMFDAFGGRITATIGCAIMTLGLGILVLLFTGLFPTGWEYFLFVLGVSLVDFGSFVQNIAFYAFLWHLPGHQTVIISLTHCCYQISSFLPVLIELVMEQSGISLTIAMGVYGGLVCLSAFLCYLVTPSKKEYQDQAMRVLGMPLPRKINNLSRSWKTVKQAARVLRMDIGEHALLSLIFLTALLSPLAYMTLAVPIGIEIFGEETGGALGDMYSTINGLQGIFIGPFFGLIVDWLGDLHWLSGAVSIGLGLVSSLCRYPDWGMQTVVICAVCLTQSLLSIFAVRYVLKFTPPNLLGSTQGVFVFVNGLFVIPLFFGFSAWLQHGLTYSAAITGSAGLAALLWFGYTTRIACGKKPWPKRPQLLLEHEAEIAKQFHVSTLADAAYVLGETKECLLNLLASSNVLDQRRLNQNFRTAEAGRRILEVAQRLAVGIRPDMPERRSIAHPSVSFYAHCAATRSLAEDAKGRPEWTGYDKCRVVLELAMNGSPERAGDLRLPWLLRDQGGMPLPVSDHQRTSFVHFYVSLRCALVDGFGYLLQYTDPESKEVVGICGVYPPGKLAEVEGEMVPVGTDRYFYALSKTQEPVAYLDKSRYGLLGPNLASIDAALALTRHEVAVKQDTWVISLLGVHPNHAGHPAGIGGDRPSKALLDVISAWAKADKTAIYIECAGERKCQLFQTRGFVVIHHETLISNPNNNSLDIYCMLKKC